MLSICVDAMGGDVTPDIVLQGCSAALAEDPEIELLVAGPEEVVVPYCAKESRARALVCTEAIEMDEHPADAVRSKKDSTIVRGLSALKTGEAQAFFSAGSTGAIFAAATLYTGRIKGIKRPAIAFALPGLNGKMTVFLDMGANADVRPEMLVQFAQMGRAYAKSSLQIEDPKVALLNNGEEETKGSELAIAAHAALKAAGPDWFVGNCEGTDLLAGRFDVIVTDGFSGNIALKTLEGTAKFLMTEIKAAAQSSKKSALGALLLKPAFKEVANKLSGDAYGGAYLLGVKAPVLIGHGSSSVEAVKNGTLGAARALRQDLVGKIKSELSSEA